MIFGEDVPIRDGVDDAVAAKLASAKAAVEAALAPIGLPTMYCFAFKTDDRIWSCSNISEKVDIVVAAEMIEHALDRGLRSILTMDADEDDDVD